MNNVEFPQRPDKGGLSATEFRRHYPMLADELTTIPTPPVRVWVLTGRHRVRPATAVTLAVLGVLFEVVLTWAGAYAIDVLGWSPWYWIGVALCALCALIDTGRTVDLMTAIRRARRQGWRHG